MNEEQDLNDEEEQDLKNRKILGTLEEAQEEIKQAFDKLTELYIFTLKELKTTPRSKSGKHIDQLVNDVGSRMLFALNSIDLARRKTGQ